MRERAKRLRPHDAKVAQATVIDLCKDAVEDVAQQMAREARDDRLTASIAKSQRLPHRVPALQVIRHIAERVRHWDLDPESHRSQCVTRERSKAKRVDNGRRVRVKRALRAIVAQCDEEVDPKAPVAKLAGSARRDVTCVPLTARLNASSPMCFFFLPFMGSSSTTRVRRM